VGSGRERQQSGSRPAKCAYNRECEKIAGPSEIAAYVRIATEEANADGSERSRQKEREQQERDSRQLASERRAGRGVSARGRVRVA